MPEGLKADGVEGGHGWIEELQFEVAKGGDVEGIMDDVCLGG